MANLKFLSYSRFNTMVKCPKQFEYRYVVEVPVYQEPSTPLIFGNAGHLMMEEGFDFFQDIKNQWDSDFFNAEQKGGFLAEYEIQNARYFKGISDDKRKKMIARYCVEHLSSEEFAKLELCYKVLKKDAEYKKIEAKKLSFNKTYFSDVRNSNITIHAIIDGITKDQNTIPDYKFVKQKPGEDQIRDYKLQGLFYAYSIWIQTKLQKFPRVKFFVVTKGTIIPSVYIYDFHYTREHFIKFEHGIISAYKDFLAAEEYEPKPEYLTCRWCNYNKLCTRSAFKT